jgi:hypothetical protein
MNKEFVPYEIALALKELGFNEPCFGWYGPTGIFNDWESTDTIAPLYQQAFRWFREKYDLHSNIISTNMWTTFSFTIDDIQNKNCIATHLDFTRCEEAELACLEKLIEIVKEKK